MSNSTNPSAPETPDRDVPAPGAMRWAMLAVILVAFGLRAFRLDYQSLWSDEGISLLRAAQPLPQLWRTMPVEHVPGYFVLLHGWMRLVGDTDYALRYLSLLPGVFAVALMMRTGRDLGSSRAGLIAGALLATSAFQVWYSQEVRMYSWLLASGLVSTWCLWLIWTRPRSVAVWLGYVFSSTVAIYLHYFGFLIPVVHSAAAILLLAMRKDWAVFLRWVSAGAAVFALFLPWSVRALELFGFSGWRAPIDPNEVPWLLLRTYTAGETMPAVWAQATALLHLALIALGAAAWIRRDRLAGLFLTTLAAAAVLVTWLLVIRQPDFHVRYTIFVSAPLTLLAAGGLAGLNLAWWRRSAVDAETSKEDSVLFRALPWLGLGFLVALNGLALHRLYHDESVQKPDFRSAAAHIQGHLQPGDIVLVDGPNPELVFEHYYHGSAPVHDLRRLEGLSDAEVDGALRTITANADRAWELLYFKPPGPVQVWLATRGWASPPTDHNGIRVQLVGLPSGSLERRLQGVYFGEALELVASEYDPGPHSPGDLVRISTDWQTHARAPEYKFSLRVADDNGVEVYEVDYVPQNWFAPTHVWFVGEPARDQPGLLLPGDLAPGSYHVTLRLYDPYTGAPVETTAGVDVPIAAFSVEDGRAHGQ